MDGPPLPTPTSNVKRRCVTPAICADAGPHAHEHRDGLAIAVEVPIIQLTPKLISKPGRRQNNCKQARSVVEQVRSAPTEEQAMYILLDASAAEKARRQRAHPTQTPTSGQSDFVVSRAAKAAHPGAVELIGS